MTAFGWSTELLLLTEDCDENNEKGRDSVRHVEDDVRFSGFFLSKVLEWFHVDYLLALR